MRTTIDLPDDLYKQVLSLARDTSRTVSATIADLIRRGLGQQREPDVSYDPRTGLPTVSFGDVLTTEDVRSLEDDE